MNLVQTCGPNASRPCRPLMQAPTTLQPSRGRIQAACSASSSRFVEAAIALTKTRARHQEAPELRFHDPLSSSILEAFGPELEMNHSRESYEGIDIEATAYVDQQVLTALSLVDLDLKQEYRQVVLLGCGFDTRPYRLLWPEGTVIYEVAPSEAHTVAFKALKAQKASVSRGSLFRRVPWEFEAGTSFATALRTAGHQGRRLSVWGIQGLSGMNLADEALREVLTQVSMASAFGSIVVGELPAMTKQQAENLLAEHSFLGIVRPTTNEDPSQGFKLVGESRASMQEGGVQRWLFTTQHKQLSADEEDIYDQHSKAGEEIDEDFFDNFS